MNLEELERLVSTAEEKEWCGRKVWIRKLGADDHLELFGRIKSEAEKPLSPEDDRVATLAFHVSVVAKAWSSGKCGELVADSERGRKAISKIPFPELVEFGELILAHSGYQTDGAPEKKS